MTGSSTHFVFRHKVFGVEGGYFSAPEKAGGACFDIPMGEVAASGPRSRRRRTRPARAS